MAKCENESVWGNQKKACLHTKVYSEQVGQSGIQENPLSTAGVTKILSSTKVLPSKTRAQIREWRAMAPA